MTRAFETQCAKLALETEEVRCVRVQDSIECANLLNNGSSGFGVFSAESALLLATMHYDGLTVLKELRHRDRLNCKHSFPTFINISRLNANHNSTKKTKSSLSRGLLLNSYLAYLTTHCI